MPTILAFDTSADSCAAALVRDGETICCDVLSMSRGYAEALAPLVQRLFRKANISFADLDVVGVTRGPGSFTGIRTGLAAARGFSYAAECPAVGVSSLLAVAAEAVQGGKVPVLVVLETRRADYYVQMFDPGARPLGGPAVMDTEDICRLIKKQELVVAGNAAFRLREEILSTGSFDTEILPVEGVPNPVVVAGIAENILITKGVVSDTLSPLYLRAPETRPGQWVGALANVARAIKLGKRSDK